MIAGQYILITNHSMNGVIFLISDYKVVEMDISEKITNQLANTISERISRKVELSLKRMKDGLQSSEDSGLENLWDEVCVQVQAEHSMFWRLYDNLIYGLTLSIVKKQESYEMAAMWLQTDGGQDWKHEVSEKDCVFGYCAEDIAEYIAREYVYEKAGTYRNKKIIKYLETNGHL
jgi:hypothetical protein